MMTDDGNLGVLATPDDGIRLSSRQLWDEAARPAGPVTEPPESGYTRYGRQASASLVGVHNHLREELAAVRDLIAQVASGAADAGQARSAISQMTMRQNNWTMGAYCASYCRLVTMHHSVEDALLFPQLRERSSELAAVIDRLKEEHVAIHDVLEALDQALVAHVANPGDLGELQDVVDLLTDGLLSHLAYEERELIGPLARYGYVG
jgi:iron-sulfur cluster repair protein YtfE (RIC family)